MSRDLHYILNNIITIIYGKIIKKVDIISIPLQISIMIDIVYKNKNIVISADTRICQSLLYSFIFFIQKKL